jgi:hypothetical protein
VRLFFSLFIQQFLYFLPLPQGHSSLRPILGFSLLYCFGVSGGIKSASINGTGVLK